MNLQSFLGSSFPECRSMAFFSSEYVFRQLLYAKVRGEVEKRGGQLSLCFLSDPDAFEKLQAGSTQMSLFGEGDCHCFFGDESDFRSSRAKPFCKLVEEHSKKKCSWPVILVGSFQPNVNQKKMLSGIELWISEPCLRNREELRQVFAFFGMMPSGEHVSLDAFGINHHVLEGDVTRAFNMCLRDVLAQDSVKDGEPKRPGQQPEAARITVAQDLFSLAKRLVHSKLSVTEVLESTSKLVRTKSDWFPLLGIIQKLAVESHRKDGSKVLDAVLFADHVVKHVYPSSQWHVLEVFLIVLLCKILENR